MLKKFDFFPKISLDSQRTTAEGGVISLLGIIFAIILFINETILNNQKIVFEQLDLFHYDKPDLTIHLEVTFFHLECSHLELAFSTVSSSSPTSTTSWTIRSINKTATYGNEGCFLVAQVDIGKYENGEMHVALSPHALPFGDFGFTIFEFLKFNSSHELSFFSIGSADSHRDTLESLKFSRKSVPAHGSGRFLYDFHVVPYLTEEKSTRNPHQPELSYFLQCLEQDVITKSEGESMFSLQKLGLPGLFISVQFSQLMIKKFETMPVWYEYLIDLLGIIAGTTTIVAFVDSFLHETLWKKKLD